MSSRRIAANALPGRSITFNNIAWLTTKVDVSGSGEATFRRSKVGCPHDTKPGGGFLRTILRSFFGSSPALATARSFSMVCSGAMTTTRPEVS